jgi:hypothetical protein
MKLVNKQLLVNVISEKCQNLIDFVGEFKGYSIYLHTTDTVEKAKSICENGLRFLQFEKTTDSINNIVALIYMANIREPFGNFTVVIQISRHITDYEAISKKVYDEDEEEIFIFPPQYIKGYYDRTTYGIFANPLFRK